jgi:Icc protein
VLAVDHEQAEVVPHEAEFTLRILEFNPCPFHALRYAVSSSITSSLPFHEALVDGLPDGLEAIIAAGDLQGSALVSAQPTDPGRLGALLASEICQFRKRGELPSTDATAILLAGDLQPTAGSADVRDVWLTLADACRWIAGVAGNHDAFGPEQCGEDISQVFCRHGVHLLDNRIISIGSLRIAGLSGMVGTTGEPWVRREHDFALMAGALARLGPEILVLHDGPNVAETSLTGWPSVRRAIEAAPPTFILRGHDAWQTPLATLANGTQVVNVDERVVILRPDRKSTERTS